MADVVEVGCRVLARTRITAADVAALEADTQMRPVLLTELHAVLAHTDVAAGRTRVGRRVDPDLREFWTSGLDTTGFTTGVTGAGTGSTEQTHTLHYPQRPAIPDGVASNSPTRARFAQ